MANVGASTSTSMMTFDFEDHVEEYSFFDMDYDSPVQVNQPSTSKAVPSMMEEMEEDQEFDPEMEPEFDPEYEAESDEIDDFEPEPEPVKHIVKPVTRFAPPVQLKPITPKPQHQKIDGIAPDNYLARFWLTYDYPSSVFDQAAEDQRRNPSNNVLLLGRIFGAPSNRVKPCRACSGMKFEADYCAKGGKKDKKKTLVYNKPLKLEGWTQEDYENATDSCSSHYVNFMLEDREKERLAELEREMKARKKMEERKKAAAKKKGKKGAQKKLYSDEDDDYFDDDEDYKYSGAKVTYTVAKPKKRRTVWMCPHCNKSAKFGSCGCSFCDEWFHLSCVGFRSTKEVPDGWKCPLCQ